MGAKRENIEAALQASRAQRREEPVFIGELLVVAAVVRQKHVDDGTSDEDDDGRQQDREPKGREWNHAQSPSGATANAIISHARLRSSEAAVKRL